MGLRGRTKQISSDILVKIYFTYLVSFHGTNGMLKKFEIGKFPSATIIAMLGVYYYEEDTTLLSHRISKTYTASCNESTITCQKDPSISLAL